MRFLIESVGQRTSEETAEPQDTALMVPHLAFLSF